MSTLKSNKIYLKYIYYEDFIKDLEGTEGYW